jgi:hypothetical protein
MPYAYHDDGALPARPDAVFVFGSNEGGRHGRGAARIAAQRFGARYGEGRGLFGNSYAIPTKDACLQVLAVEQIAAEVSRFLAVAAAHPSHSFFVTRVGCGLAGYHDAEIAPLFRGAPPNCDFPAPWRRWLSAPTEQR